MTAPMRIQLSRRRGWRIPENTVSASRPGLLGNPFPVDVYGQEKAVDLHRRWLAGDMSTREMSGLSRCDRWSDPPGVSLVSLRSWTLEKLKEARGKNLACWCGLCPRHSAGLLLGTSCHDCKPCHTVTLLEIANR